jgi:hypothetical protein
MIKENNISELSNGNIYTYILHTILFIWEQWIVVEFLVLIPDDT